ncbi:hypothetical protein BYT27DRAFT_7240395 [Phlegmacium glaucopus]|nr:hypothetical protein BYT27DRAFT_7240395 [Phlegmacium glaucopus]
MDLPGIPMDQDHIDTPNVLSYNSDKWTDHVKWQGSQTACSALNQLIRNETAQEAPRISGWQRVSSSDQLSNLHSTDHRGTASNSSLLSSHSRPSSSKLASSSRPHSRPRLSETRAPDPDITNLDISIPLFNKANPMQFLDIMKGVSARLDENAGVRPRAKKRTRGISLGGASEFQAGKATRGTVKKGRVDELRTSDTLTWDVGNGKGRTTSEDEGLNSEVRGRGLQAHSSLPDMAPRSDLRSLSSKDASFMDVDERDDMDMECASRPTVSSYSNHGHPDTRPFARTRSQIEMPPPPIACDSFDKQRQPAADSPHQHSNAQSTSTLTPLAVSRHSNSMNQPQTSYPPPRQPPTNHSIKQRKPNAIPKLHPLLYHKPATTRVSSSSVATSAPVPQVQLQDHPAPIPVAEGPDLKPPPSSFTPMFSSTPSSRPPPLGMRRNHTFPSRTSSSSNVQQELSTSLTSSQLPRRQKGFKSPLLSLSQPQAQTQTHSLSQLKANANIIVVESDSATATSRKISSRNLSEVSIDNHGFNSTANTSMALRSSSSSSDSSTSFRSTPPATSSAPSYSHTSNSSGYSKSKISNRGMAQQPQGSVVVPEPLDGDTDSSFGDMSFDMDALEETMKKYD